MNIYKINFLNINFRNANPVNRHIKGGQPFAGLKLVNSNMQRIPQIQEIVGRLNNQNQGMQLFQVQHIQSNQQILQEVQENQNNNQNINMNDEEIEED